MIEDIQVMKAIQVIQVGGLWQSECGGQGDMRYSVTLEVIGISRDFMDMLPAYYTDRTHLS